MSSHYAYKPRLGFDIRVKPPQTDEPPIWETSARRCDAPGCARTADCRAPKSPNKIADYYWFCTDHAREYNRSWNFFEGMSEAEAAAFREAATYGHRPTWKINTGPSARAGRASAQGEAAFFDAFGIFGREGPPKHRDEKRDRGLSRLQAKAFASLGLEPGAGKGEIRAQYTALIKKFHPDSNGGDRSTEARFRDVLKAYKILRRAGLC